MARQRRFRDVKQGKQESKTAKQTKKKQAGMSRQTGGLPYATVGTKIKAFITDSFMLLMPIMYIVTYLVMGGLQNFSEQKVLGWLYILIPNFIIVFLFFLKSGQTPGCKAYSIKLVDSKTGGKAHSLAIALRYYFELISIITVVGLLMGFFRKDHQCLHDLLSGTVLIQTEQP